MYVFLEVWILMLMLHIQCFVALWVVFSKLYRRSSMWIVFIDGPQLTNGRYHWSMPVWPSIAVHIPTKQI